MRDSARHIPPSRPPSAAARAPAEAQEDSERHLHRIAVETGPEPVFVTIGRAASRSAVGRAETAGTACSGGPGHAPVPGGFAKLFNRVIDCGAWASLPDAARAVYVPMVRFAEARDGFRVRIGLAALMRYTNLSRSSVKRALRALLDAPLIAIVRAGGVAPDGTNRTNVYQLLLPEPEASEAQRLGGLEQAGRKRAQAASAQSAARAKRGRPAIDAAPMGGGTPSSPATPEPPGQDGRRVEAFPPGSLPNPLPALPRSPAHRKAEPPAGPSPVPAAGRRENPLAGPLEHGTGSEVEPPHRAEQKEDISELVDDGTLEFEDMMPEAGPVLSEQQRHLQRILEAWGLDPQVALDVVQTYSREQISRAVSSARQAKNRGGLHNPAGYIVRCLDGLQGAAEPVLGPPPPARNSNHRVEEGRALAARAAADARIDELDEATLAHLVGRVLELHARRPAMVRLLSARPPRESRLMRAEIAALLQV